MPVPYVNFVSNSVSCSRPLSMYPSRNCGWILCCRSNVVLRQQTHMLLSVCAPPMQLLDALVEENVRCHKRVRWVAPSKVREGRSNSEPAYYYTSTPLYQSSTPGCAKSQQASGNELRMPFAQWRWRALGALPEPRTPAHQLPLATHRFLLLVRPHSPGWSRPGHDPDQDGTR